MSANLIHRKLLKRTIFLSWLQVLFEVNHHHLWTQHIEHAWRTRFSSSHRQIYRENGYAQTTKMQKCASKLGTSNFIANRSFSIPNCSHQIVTWSSYYHTFWIFILCQFIISSSVIRSFPRDHVLLRWGRKFKLWKSVFPSCIREHSPRRVWRCHIRPSFCPYLSVHLSIS